MCFAPKRRALFQHRNFQKCSDTEVFCIFWLCNVLRATTVCTFWTSELPKVVRTWCVLYILTLKCASRHIGVHFFNISTSKSAPNPSVFTLLTSKCASRRNGVHFSDSSTSKNVPNVRFFLKLVHLQMCFAPPTCNFLFLIWPDSSAPAALGSLLFDPPAPQIIGKTQVFRDFRSSFVSSFFWLLLFADLLFFSSVLFSSLTLPTSASTSACPYCRKFDF